MAPDPSLQSIRQITNHLRSSNDSSHQAAVIGRARIDEMGAAALPELTAIVQHDEDPLARTIAIRAIARIQEGGEAVLVEALQDPHPTIREVTHFEMTQRDLPPAAIPILKESMHDQNFTIRYYAMQALCKGQEHLDKETLDTIIIAAWDDPKEDVQWRAIEALGNCNNHHDRVLPVLEQLLVEERFLSTTLWAIAKFGDKAKHLEPKLNAFYQQGKHREQISIVLGKILNS